MDIEKPEAQEVANEATPTTTENPTPIVQATQVPAPEIEAPESTSTVVADNEVMQDAPPLTSALEALLGGLDPSLPVTAEPSAADVLDAMEVSIPQMDDPVNQETTIKSLNLDVTPADTTTETAIKDESSQPAAIVIPGLGLASAHAPITPIAALNGEPVTEPFAEASNTAQTEVIGADEQEHPEWEVDSSPIESSSDDSSSDSSSDDSDEEGDNAYKLLSPEEQARILMQEDGGSDDEGASKSKSAGTQLRTKNEVAEVVIPKPDVVITEAMPIQELGAVEAIVEATLLIKANTSGEYRVLESQSILCLQDRSVIGVISETIGRVQQPFYSVLFTNAAEIKEAGLEVGTKVFYSEQHSTYVFTKALKAIKGSDASNLHDEEVGDDEMEFSDDEAEAEHKKRIKQKRIAKRGGMVQKDGGSSRGGHPLQQNHLPYDASAGGLSYDDNEDGPYKPLARPAGYADTVGRSEAPEEGAYQASHDRPQSRDSFRGRGRGNRGDRGRGRGDRGRDHGRGGSGGYPDRTSNGNGQTSNGYSLPPQSQRNFQPPPPPGNFQQPPAQSYQQPNFNQQAFNPQAMNFFPQQQYSPQQPQINWQQMFPQGFPGGWQNFPPPPPLPGMPIPMPGGAYLNPAFFGQQQQNQQQQTSPPPPPPPQSGNHNGWNLPKSQ